MTMHPRRLAALVGHVKIQLGALIAHDDLHVAVLPPRLEGHRSVLHLPIVYRHGLQHPAPEQYEPGAVQVPMRPSTVKVQSAAMCSSPARHLEAALVAQRHGRVGRRRRRRCRPLEDDPARSRRPGSHDDRDVGRLPLTVTFVTPYCSLGRPAPFVPAVWGNIRRTSTM